jgi:hypothetical protein
VSKAARWSLVALALIVAAVAFVIAQPGGDEADEQGSSGDTAAETAPATDGDSPPIATAPSAPKPPPDANPAKVITLRDYSVAEVQNLEFQKGDQVRLVFRSNVPDSVHIHGYDLEQEAAPGKPARFSFPANIEGVFEIESHEAEHQGKDALIARLVVEPS